MATKRVLIGFQFEGVGLDTSKAGGLCVSWGRWSPHASSALEWVEALASLPAAVSTEVNPYTGDWSTSSFSVQLLASDRLARLFLSDQRRAQTALEASLAAATTSCSIGLTTLSGQVIWIDDEAILLGTHTSSGTYTGCTRGLWGSSAVSHALGALVYTRIPQWQMRLVRLIEHDVDTGTERVRWRGLVRDIGMDRGMIAVSCDEYLAALTRASTNRSARDLAQGAGLKWEVRPASVVLRGASAIAAPSSVAQGAGSALLYVEAEGYISSVEQVTLEGGAPLFVDQWSYGRRPEATDGDTYGGSLWEVLVLPDALDGLVTAYPHTHPLTCALALLTSSGTGSLGDFDVLGVAWGLGLDVVDLASWTAEIERTPYLAIDHLVLGAGGEAVNALQVVQDTLLRPFGYFLAVTVEGLLSIARLGLPTLAAQAAAGSGASVYPDGPLVLERALGEQALEVSAQVGGTPGTGDGRSVLLREPNSYTRRSQLGDARRLSYDLQAISPRRLSTLRRGGGALVSALASLLSLGLDTVPRLRVRIADHTVTGTAAPDLGAWVTLADLGPLQDAWLVNADGERVSDVTGPSWIGMVTGRAWDLSDHSYTLTLLLLGYRVGAYVRERAPAAVVFSYNAGTLTIVTEDSIFGGDPYDATAFTVGDEVALYERDGRLASFDVRTVTSVSFNAITISSAFSSAPSAGRVLGLPYSNEFANTSRYPATPRPYAAIADVGEGVIEELDGSNSPPDIYGSSVYGGV
jgi:hypothetical protein